ncbi:MAG: hypothetical protein AAF563_25575, partial [Pseudomonadota bacterium]
VHGLTDPQRIKHHMQICENIVKDKYPSLYQKHLTMSGRMKHGLRRRKPAPKSRAMFVNGIGRGDPALLHKLKSEEIIEPKGIVFSHTGRTDNMVAFRAGWAPAKTATKHPVKFRKSVRAVVDGARVASWSKEVRRNYRSQNGVMGCSAMEEVTAAQLTVLLRDTDEHQWEWLHLISFKMGGADGHASPQNPDNFVAGSYDCNTEMINIEEAIKHFATKGATFEVEVSASMYPNCHVALQIDYIVKCNGKVLHQIFYPAAASEVTKGEVKLTKEAFQAYFGL